LGDNFSFESTTWKWKQKINDTSSPDCKVDVKDSVANPASCSPCARLPEHAPGTGNWGDKQYLAGQPPAGDFCRSNQVWVMGKMTDRKKNPWKTVLYPPDVTPNSAAW
jgi:hypothetical protein